MSSRWNEWQLILQREPFLAVAFLAAAIAFASTPVAFAIFARSKYFQARRGRTLQRPSWPATIAALVLVMAFPAIFCGLVVKSRYYDIDRYEFDPNRLAARGPEERTRLDEERRKLVEGIKALDAELLKVRALATQSQPLAKALNPALEKVAAMRRSVGLDAPQQRIDEVGLPVELPGVPPLVVASTTPAANTPTTAPAAPATSGLPKDQVAAEVAGVPEPQRPLAAMLPLSDLPPGWVIGTMNDKHLETFAADNLFEKINGRAESFVQFDVKGMAYTFYHPEGDEASELQLYIFELGNPLKAFGKFGTEKPSEGTKPIDVGAGGYTAAGSTFFHQGPYYTQIVATADDPKLAAFAHEVARRIAVAQGASPPPAPAVAVAPAPMPTPDPTPPPTPAPAPPDPTQIFKLLPAEPKKDREQFIVEDVFGYSFLTQVFLAEYQDGDVSFQGFLRPCATPEAARALFEEYVNSVKQDGASVKPIEGSGAEAMVTTANIGLFDTVFVKKNVFGGANGATAAEPAEQFAKALVAGLPAEVPSFDEPKPETKPETP